MSKLPLRILLEMRPALDGHAGIPQETRLLFRGLSTIDDFAVEGLIQSSGHVLSRGLPPNGSWGGALSTDGQLNRLSRVVISLQQQVGWPGVQAVAMALRHVLGASEALTRFDPANFRDFIWRRLFALTLPPEDFDIVTRASYRIARVPWTAMHRCALVTRRLGYTLHPRLDTREFDVMIAETPYPATVSSRTSLVVRYHDAIPLLMPHTISDRPYHQASHYHALRSNVRSGALFACVSNATRNDLLSIFPQAEPRAVTIYNMVSHHYYDEESPAQRIPEILRTRRNDEVGPRPEAGATSPAPSSGATAQAPDYLLIVSTIEPRKNHATLLAAWEQLRAQRFPNLKLVVVGMLGWEHASITRKFLPWIERGDLVVLVDVPAPELRLLYKHARATVCPSLSEGFDFSGVETMKCGGAVVASDIPVHREVFVDAAEFFSPYSVDRLALAIANVIDPAREGRRAELVQKGAAVSRRYSPEVILPKWCEFLSSAPRRAAAR